jgi:uncharacterized protein (DUF433 family)
MDYKMRIELNPDIMLGKPVIRGTRLTVETVLRKLSQGAVVEDLLIAYPNIVKDDIYACLQYASALIANEETIILKAS